ncbi:hypothetical protein [Synechococcus sp. A15-44]|uniref:Eco57I restriction-modification methylase domain-containing protein n=1 Tax=Synechococcus sp. A15-44 TaxID=1050646 RepID=UPI001648D1C3|nr:hypothetical protein [Synechococcus sp. A15-44]QNI63513.1 Putative Type IIC bifunctional restriction-modification protein with endonuclease and N6-adenine DNA methyltransferase activity [Synechococcus sp. A15-44]
MEKDQRTRLQKATQDARRLLEEEFRSQLLQAYDIDVDKVRWAEEPGAHLLAEQRLIREKLVAWIEHKEAQINDRKEALLLALREMAFTALNRFVALKLMEARELVRPCVSGGLESAGFLEFTAVAQGLLADQESSYRLYLETIFEDVSRELRALFDPRDPASLLWPKRAALLELLDILNRPELAELWSEDETLGWVYQYFNDDAERRKMREESAAPRNSRELAVRNQFFTPRYVVEFLTDNTLGRIWYEMRQGDTDLKDRCRYLLRRPNEIWLQPGEEAPARSDTEVALSQEELLRQPVHIPHRELKDPREIRMLDPACGSMHFGLYAFDLYLKIYEEAWQLVQCSDEQAKHCEAFAAFADYAASIEDKAAFLSEIPKLIIQHNVHGIDIDPRATQIARLTLWLRAQRAWKEQKLETADRPPINRSNVVCAEPMPGERELLADFVDQQFPEAERGLVQQLLETIFDKMQLAGEAGSLLKIDEEIRDAIDRARREWQKLAVQQRDLFGHAELAVLGEVGSSLEADLQSLTKDFWINIEERIYSALSSYSGHAENGGGFQRRLFVEDAAQGFAFIDACRKSYDVTLMNPPFGDSSKPAKDLIFSYYDRERIDIGGCFITRFGAMLAPGGKLGVIANRTLLFAATLEEWRMSQLAFTETALDLGHGVLDALVETAAFTLSRQSSGTAFFIGAIDAPEKDESAVHCIKSFVHSKPSIGVIRTIDDFRCLYGAPFAYWAPQSLIEKIKHLPLSEDLGVIARQGLATCDNFRFLRLSQELPLSQGRNNWYPLAKGGEYQPFWADVPLRVNWGAQGKEVKAFVDKLHGQWSRVIQSTNLYGVPGATFSARTASSLSLRVLPQNVIFDKKGPFVGAEDKLASSRLGAILVGLSYTTPYRFLVETAIGLRDATTSGSAARDYLPSTIQRLPWPDLPDEQIEKIFQASLRAILAMRQIESIKEGSSHEHEPIRWSIHYSLPEVARSHFLRWISLQEKIYAEADLLEAMSYESFGASDADVLAFESVAGRSPLSYSKDINVDPGYVCELLETSVEGLIELAVGSGKSQSTIYKKGYWGDRSIELISHICECHPLKLLEIARACSVPSGWIKWTSWRMLSASIGILFGRIAPASYFADSSDVLPVSPFVVTTMGSSDMSPVQVSEEPVFCDDAGHQRDIVGILSEVLKSYAGGISLEQLCVEIDPLRGPREFLRGKFFELHLSAASAYRRQAPIYWQVSAANGSYSAWLYYHRFTQDTLYRVLRDFVEPRIQQTEREQFELESQGALSGDAAVRLQEAQTLLQDLRILKSELDLVAPLWNPNLNDGVIINHAILWRITPYTPWQKKCKGCWDKLMKGDYDWAHLAFHLWPERVISKCTTDRSLAIAHGLEERLWQETNNGNWLPRQLSEAGLQALIAEHSNPAVKSALERFLAAPPPVAPTRTRASRSTRSTGSSAQRRPRGTAAVVDAEATRQVLLALTAAPSDGLAKAAIADLIGVEANALTAVIKQLKESGQIDQLGERRGARYVLSEQRRAAVASETEVEA